MKAVSFKGCNTSFGAPGCYDIPAHTDGARNIMCFEFTPEEIEQLQKNPRVYVALHSGKTICPISVSIENMMYKNIDAFCLITYESVVFGSNAPLTVWNPIDEPAPFRIKNVNGNYKRSLTKPAVVCHIKELHQGDYFFYPHPDTGINVLVKVLPEMKEEYYDIPE